MAPRLCYFHYSQAYFLYRDSVSRRQKREICLFSLFPSLCPSKSPMPMCGIMYVRLSSILVVLFKRQRHSKEGLGNVALRLSFPIEKHAGEIFKQSFNPNVAFFHTIYLCRMIHESSGASSAQSIVLCLDITVITKRKCMKPSGRQWNKIKSVYTVDLTVVYTDPCLKNY